MGLSVIQNGKIPTFLTEEMLVDIFQKPDSGLFPAVSNTRKGLKETGLYQASK